MFLGQNGTWTLVISMISLASLVPPAVALKFLSYNPIFGHSHANFQGKVADALAEAGHEVVMLSPVTFTALKNVTSKHARLILVPPNDFVRGYQRFQEETISTNLWTAKQGDPFFFIKPMENMTGYLAEHCRVIMDTPGLMDSLRAEQFDGAFSECIDACGFGLFHLLGIKKFAVTQSMADIGRDAITGVPGLPSFQPALMSVSGDQMSFFERFSNLLCSLAWNHMIGVGLDGMQTVFDERYNDFPRLEDIVKNASYFFVNSEPLIDFPHIVSRKTIDIGGIALPTEWHPLGEPLSAELSLRPRTVLISFGSVMLARLMPENLKQGIRSLALALPDVTFIWKYEKPEDDVAAGIPNLITHTWLPQTDMLRDARLSAFVTHGGAGSSYETVLAGVPALVVPVMGDQMRNAEMIKRIGAGAILDRDDLGRPERLIQAVKDILENDRYRQRAREVSKMVESQPQSVRRRLVSHMEFMARFGPLEQLNHVGRDMNIVTFYNLDIFAAFVLAVLFAVGVLVFIVTKLCSLFVRAKAKTD